MKVELLSVNITKGGAEVSFNKEILECFNITIEEIEEKFDSNKLLESIKELIGIINPD